MTDTQTDSTGPNNAGTSTDPFAAYGGHVVPAAPAQSSESDPFAKYAVNGASSAAAPSVDPFAKYAVVGTPKQTPSQSVPSASPTDPFVAYGGHSVSRSGDSPASASTPSNPFDRLFAPSASANPFDNLTSQTDPFAEYGGKAVSTPATQSPASSNPFDRAFGIAKPAQSPENGQPAADPNAPWYKKAWAWANEPLLAPTTIEHGLGMDPNATDIGSGVARGAVNIAAGLSSPLSLLLTLGTFGTGAVEGVGASVLREAGLSAAEVADAANGANVLRNAVQNGHTLEDSFQAVSDAGFDADKLKSAIQTVEDSGVGRDSLTSQNMFRRVAGKTLQSAGVGAGKADTYSKYIAAGVSAGFSAQQLHQAAIAAPRVLDQIKDGDYGEAAQNATEALIFGALGYAGAKATIREAGDLVPAAEAALGLRVKPSEETQKLINEFGTYDADVAKNVRDAKTFAKNARATYSEIVDDPVRLHRVKNLIEANLNPETMTDRFNSLAHAAGREERIPKINDLLDLPEGHPAETIEDTHLVGMSPERINQLEQEQRIAQTYAPKEIDHLLSAYDSRELQPEDYDLAKWIKERHDDTLTAAQQAGVLQEGVENYTTNLWEEDNPALNRLSHEVQTNGSFAVNTSMARHRAFANSFEGQLAGYKLRPEATDPIQTAAHNQAQFAKVIAARQTLGRLQDKNTVASDGRPVLAASGTGRVLTNEDGEPLATLVNPEAVRSIRIAQPVIDHLKASGDLDRLLDDGKIVQLDKKSRAARLQELFSKEGAVNLTPDEQSWVADVATFSGEAKPVYAWRPFDYKSIDSPVLRDWNFAASDSAGNPVTLLSELKVHPKAYDYLQRRLGDDVSPVRRSPIGKAALSVASELKGLLLGGLSPFHVVQTAGRALMAGISPLVPLDKWSLEDPEIYKAVEHGLTLPAGSSLRDFDAGMLSSHSKILSHIPVLGPLQDSLNTFLFHDYIPSLKVKTFPAILERMRKANPEWTENKLYEEAAGYTNDLYGGQPWKRLGATAASQDFQRLFLLAPDWLRSELNLAARLVRPGQSVSQIDALRMTAGVWVAARVGNMLLNNGQMHLEAPFAISNTDKEGKQTLYSIRTLPTDLLHLVQDPRGFALIRLSPLVKTGSEAFTGRDEYGRKIPAPTFFGNLLANSMPISMQNLGKAFAGETPDVSTTDQVLRALGATTYRYRTEAGKLADQLASDRAPSGVIPDPALIRYHQVITHLEDQLRAGEVTLPEIGRAVQTGDLSPKDFHQIEKNFAVTREMDADTARLYVRASKLPIRDFLRVWSIATPSERSSLSRLFSEKRKKYLSALPASRRATDPVARELSAIYPF